MAQKKTCDSLENQRLSYKKILGRTRKFQIYLNQMCHVISNHAVKMAGLRDKNDELAKCLDGFTKVEEFSTTSKLTMAVAAELMATVGDHQDLAIQRTETMVLPNISSYGRICDCVKADVWNAIQAIKREKVKRKSANLLRKKSRDPKVKKAYDDAMRELERASAETSRLCQLSQEQVIKFEHKRLMDLKESLGNFLKIQISTHAKCLELLSQTYKHVQSIDEDGDLDILVSLLKLDEDNGTSCKKKNSVKGKGKEDEIKEDSQSDSDSFTTDYTTDSSHSEIVRHIEKVLKSGKESGGGGGGDAVRKVPSKTSSKSDLPKTKYHSSSEQERDGGRKKKSEGEIRSQVHSVSSHSYYSDHSGHSTKQKRSEVKVTKGNRKDEYDSDTYTPVHSKSQNAKTSKRPTTPPRPLTVPTRMSSPEDESTSRTDPSYKFRGKTTNVATPRRTTQMGDYYYSMSEEDRSRREQQQILAGVKHVSFTTSSGVSSHRKTQEFAGKSLKQNQRQYSNYSQNSYTNRDAEVLFAPVKSSLKKYC